MNSSPLLEPLQVSEREFLLPNSDHEVPAIAVPPAAGPAPGVWEALLWTFGFLVMTQLFPGAFLAFMSIDSSGKFVMRDEYFLPALLGGQILGVCLSLLALRVRVGRNWTDAIQFRRPALRPCLLAVLCVPAMLMVGFGVETGIENLTGAKEPTAEVIGAGMTHYPMWFCMLVVAVGAAVNEELFCRGFLGRGLVGRYGILIGVLLTSVVFGAIHLNLPQGVWAAILGCFLHLAYLTTRSLWTPLLLHFLNNAIAVMLATALQNFEPATWQLVTVTVAAFAIALPSAWALFRLRELRMIEA